jgi:hypothetical protein
VDREAALPFRLDSFVCLLEEHLSFLFRPHWYLGLAWDAGYKAKSVSFRPGWRLGIGIVLLLLR